MGGNKGWRRKGGGGQGSCWRITGNLKMAVTFRHTLMNSTGEIRCEAPRRFICAKWEPWVLPWRIFRWIHWTTWSSFIVKETRKCKGNISFLSEQKVMLNAKLIYLTVYPFFKTFCCEYEIHSVMSSRKSFAHLLYPQRQRKMLSTFCINLHEKKTLILTLFCIQPSHKKCLWGDLL